MKSDNISEFIASYACEMCLGPIPIHWAIVDWYEGKHPIVDDPSLIVRARAPFNFEHVPENIRGEITEALDCLSVGAYNGFAAFCRRSIQAICTDLGADATSKVQKQIEEMIELTGLGDEWKELAFQIMLSGHNGAHPNLPEVNADRAPLLVSLLQDLTYQLYTRPGKVKEAAVLRRAAIESKKED